MRRLVFACTKTGQEVDSGLVVDKDFEPFALLLDVPLRCPHCRERDVFKADTGALRRAA